MSKRKRSAKPLTVKMALQLLRQGHAIRIFIEQQYARLQQITTSCDE